MTRNEFENLKPGDVVMYIGKGPRHGLCCVMTGDDSRAFDLNGNTHKGMCLLGSENIWDEEAPWRRTFRDNKCSHWKKVECIIIK